MRHTMFAAALVGLFSLFGCERETTIKTTETIEGPGGTTTVTTEKTVESTGENPPVSSTGESIPPRDNDRDVDRDRDGDRGLDNDLGPVNPNPVNP